MKANALAQKKEKDETFYFLIKIPKNGKSMFPNCIDRFGRQKINK